MTYQRALAGTDGSATARIAEETAAYLAGCVGARLLLLHAHPPGGEDRAAEVLEGARARLEAVVPGVEGRVHPGDAGEVLVRVAGEEGADVVVVGNVGMPGRIRARLPSVPNYVSHRVPCDLLLVQTAGSKPAPPVDRYRRMLVATDGSRTATEAVRRGIELAGRLRAQPTLLFVGEEARGRAALEKTLAAVPADGIETRIVRGQPVDGICDTAKREGFGLIVVGNKGMSGGGGFTLESVPDRVTHFAAADVLLVRTAATSIKDLAAGEGGLVMAGDRRLAAFRGEDGVVHTLSSTCTHMGCTVAWNRGERTWDCPCHGSRYTPEGEVLSGPATRPLERVETPEP